MGRHETRFVTVELKTPEITSTERKPLDLAVVIDNSGSMSGDKIANARRAAHHLVDQLGAEDRFSLVVFDSTANVVVPATSVHDRTALHAAIDRIDDAGGTNLYAGLDLGLQGLSRDGRIPRLILLSDGQTNEGITDPLEIARRAGNAFEKGVGISTIGLGIDFNEDLLFSIAKSGGGSYDFVDNPSQLASVFSDELDRSAALAGRQAVIDLDLGPGVEGVEVLGWAATRTDDGWRISLGDLPSSSTRRVVARVTVAAGSEGVFEGATARATWLDREGVAMAASDTSRIEATRSIAHADSSIIESVAGAAAYVYGNTLSMRSASAYAKGDEEGAEAYLNQSREQLNMSGDLGVKKAKTRLAGIDRQAAAQRDLAPSSRAGKRSIKQMKAMSALGYMD
jgi:Ca-activated chloride channel family protein